MLHFETIGLKELHILKPVSEQYGGGSCQNSYLNWLIRQEKYGDQYCFVNGFLVIYRKGMETDTFRNYLFPLGDCSDLAALKACIETMMMDAKAYGKRLCFCSVTGRDLELIRTMFFSGEGSEQFTVETNRDYFEYIFRTDTMAKFPGQKLADRRWQVNRFCSLYENRYTIAPITETDFEEIRAFRTAMLEAEDREKALEETERHFETSAFNFALTYFQELELLGIVIRIDGRVVGYNIGAKISNDMIDGLFMIGDRRVKYIYSMLFQQFAKAVENKAGYINAEEDIGLEGLRTAKLELQPEYLLEKYIVRF